MRKNQTLQAYRILQKFSKEQLRAFEKFIDSPYHVTHEGVHLMYMHFKKASGKRQEEQEALLRQAPELTAKDRRQYDYHSYLLEALERFLAVEQERINEVGGAIRGVAGLRKLKLQHEADALLRHTRKKMEQKTKTGVEDFRNRYLLQEEAYLLSLQQGRSKAFNVQELADAQDVAYICEKLRTGCLLLSHEALNKQIYDKELLLKILDFLDGHRFLQIPMLAVYYHGYYAQSDGDNGVFHFQSLKSLLRDAGESFTQSERHDLYLMALNFCIKRINRQETTYLREIFDLYQLGLKQGALLEDQVMSRWTYGNIAVTALRLKEYDWLFDFLHQYAPLVPENHREGALNHGLARYYYEIGQSEKALHCLMKVEYDDILQNLTAKVLLAKIYYETRALDSLESHLDSIQIYLRRKKVLGYHKDNYSNIVRYIRKLAMLNLYDKNAVQAYKTDVEKETVLTEKPWLLKMLS